MFANRAIVSSSKRNTQNSADASRALLSTDGQTLLRTAIGSSNSDLRWPDFSDYTKNATKFYESNGNALRWIKDWEPTPQAQQLITLLLQADQKGLSPEDYDGPRCDAELPLSQLEATQPGSVHDHGKRAERHGGTCKHGAEKQAEQGVEHSCRDRDAKHVVEKREEEILSNIAHGTPAEAPRLGDSTKDQ